jgi:NAD(P)-dependent dehydrogenase (short-subunit alcohol dehydrogenase family)
MELFQPDLLKDQVIIITGGGSGLGRSMGLRFAELGASIVLTSRDKSKLDKAATEMSERGAPEVLTISCDVREPDQVEAMVEETWKHFDGKVTRLINNAAGNFISPTERLSYNAFNAVEGIVLRGSFNCSLALGKRWLAAQQSGMILSIVTTYAWTGSAFVVPSACAKAGVLAMTRSLAVEWGRKGIRCNAIAPGPFPTEGAWERLVPPGFEKVMTERIPLKRPGRHEELANLATYLVSPFAEYINGEVVTIDGGEWLQGAGEFNWGTMIPDEMWDQMAAKGKKS